MMMMKSARITGCCVALLLTLTSVSAVRRVLNSISDLRSIDFGQSVPIHSLVLLHWFANTVDIDRNGDIRLTFNPNHDYGSHHYVNIEGLLERSPRGFRYYTIGNINEQTSMNQHRQFPPHVRPQPGERNRARIIIRVREQTVGDPQVDRVFITQHFERFDYQRSEYDPDQTYEVTTNLLRELREFSMENHDMRSLMSIRDRFGGRANDYQLQNIREMWGHLASLGLLFLIVGYTRPVSYYHNQSKMQSAPRRNDLWSNTEDSVGFLCSVFLVVVILVVLLLAAASKK